MKIKIIVSILLLSIIIDSYFLIGFADLDTSYIIEMEINNPNFLVNEINMAIDPGRDTKPLIKDNRTIVPIRSLIECIGGTVEWNKDNQQVTILVDTIEIKMWIGQKKLAINNFESEIDVAPEIINSRTYLPLRYIFERINYYVLWDKTTAKILILSNQYVKEKIEPAALNILKSLKEKDMETFSNFVHAAKGIKFSQYLNVKNSDLIFNKKQVENFSSDSKVYKWGIYDGNGEPINLNFEQYYQNFIYNIDYLTKYTKISYNQISTNGNSIDNTLNFYPNSMLVDFYYPGTAENGYSDWNELKLAVEYYNGNWYLVGLIHGLWTI